MTYGRYYAFHNPEGMAQEREDAYRVILDVINGIQVEITTKPIDQFIGAHALYGEWKHTGLLWSA